MKNQIQKALALGLVLAATSGIGQAAQLGWRNVYAPVLTERQQATNALINAAILKAQEKRFKEVQAFNKPVYITNKVQKIVVPVTRIVYVTNTVVISKP